jgi:hypothetical protein
MRTAWLLVGLLCLAPPASAQEAPSLRAHQVTISGGITWSGGYDIGDATAQLRGNGSGASAPPFNLFTAGSRITSAVAPTVQAGFAITPRVAIEGGLTLAHPRIAIAISGDAEASNQELPGEKLDQYQIDAGLTWQLPVRMGRSLAPFVSFGGGYLRQLHEDRALAETGQVFYGGIGARYWLRGGRGASTAIGIRGDVTLMLRRNGIDFDDSARTYPAAKLMLFVGL